MSRHAIIGLALTTWLAGCTYMVPVKSTEAYSIGDCEYVGTFEEINNPGQVSFGTLKHYFDTTTVELRVKLRAYQTGATHLVWLYKHSEAAGALAYSCPEGAPAADDRLAALDFHPADSP